MIINRVIGGNIQKGVSVTVHGAVYEDITLSDGQVITTDANGEGTAVVNTGTITLTGSVSGQSFTETVTDATTDIYCMPKGALYWYGNECTAVTGGWHNVVSTTKNTNSITIEDMGDYESNAIACTNNSFSTSEYNTFCFIDNTKSSRLTDSYGTINVWSHGTKVKDSYASADLTTSGKGLDGIPVTRRGLGEHTVKCEITNKTVNTYAAMLSYMCSGDIKAVWLE